MLASLVSSNVATITDFGVVESGINQRVGENVSRSLAFSKLVTETIFSVPFDEVDEHIVDGGADRGIDIIYIDHNNRKINIGTCKTVVNFKNSKKSFPAEEIDKIISFVDDLLLHHDQILINCNGRLAAKIRQIWEIFSENCYEVSVHIFSNQLTLPKDGRDRLSSALSRHKVSMHEYGLFELSHGLVKSKKPKFKKTLIGCLAAGDQFTANEKRAIITRVSLRDLSNFLSDENGSFDERMIWQNVRYFLGIENDVNREIKQSLLGSNVEDFWFLNSGLTVVCDQIMSYPNGRHPITMVNPQIVNGCQTAHVVQSIASETMRNLDDGYLMVRIIETANPEFIERLALASNTQSRISNRDLRANEKFQIQLAECLKSEGYFYCRKRGEKNPSQNLRVIDAARAGQLMLSYLCGEPTKSKTNSNEIFGELYEEAFNHIKVTPELVITAHVCHVQIEKRRQEAIHFQSSIAKNSFEETWIIEGHFHVLFVLGEMIRRLGKKLDDREIALSLVNSAIDVVQKFVNKNKGIASYRLFRSAKSRDEIYKILESTNEVPNLSFPKQLGFDF